MFSSFFLEIAFNITLLIYIILVVINFLSFKKKYKRMKNWPLLTVPVAIIFEIIKMNSYFYLDFYSFIMAPFWLLNIGIPIVRLMREIISEYPKS